MKNSERKSGKLDQNQNKFKEKSEDWEEIE